MSQSPLSKPSRRRFITSAAGLSTFAIAAPFIITSRKAFGAGKLVLVSWGGSYRTAVETSLVKPFSQEMGVDVTVVDTPDLAKVKAQQMTGNVEWDVLVLSVIGVIPVVCLLLPQVRRVYWRGVSQLPSEDLV